GFTREKLLVHQLVLHIRDVDQHKDVRYLESLFEQILRLQKFDLRTVADTGSIQHVKLTRQTLRQNATEGLFVGNTDTFRMRVTQYQQSFTCALQVDVIRSRIDQSKGVGPHAIQGRTPGGPCVLIGLQTMVIVIVRGAE